MDSDINLNQETSQTITEQAQTVVDTIKEQGQEKATQVAGQIREQVQAGISQTMNRAAESVSAVSETLHEVCHKLNESGNAQLGGYVHQAHQSLDSLTDYLKNRQLDEIVGDVEGYARQRPGVFIGSLFVAGFLAGRFLRSSAPPQTTKALVPYEGPPHGYAGVAYRSPDVVGRS